MTVLHGIEPPTIPECQQQGALQMMEKWILIILCDPLIIFDPLKLGHRACPLSLQPMRILPRLEHVCISGFILFRIQVQKNSATWK